MVIPVMLFSTGHMASLNRLDFTIANGLLMVSCLCAALTLDQQGVV